MTVLSVAEVRAFLRITHTNDDELLLQLIAGAEAEALMWMDRQDLPRAGEDEPPDECDTSVIIDVISEGTSLAPDVRVALFHLVQARYEGSPKFAAGENTEIDKLRSAALAILAPHRRRHGA